MKLLKHKYILAISLLVLTFMPLSATAVMAASGDGTDSINDQSIGKNDCKDSLSKDNCATVKLIVTITNIMAGIAGLVIIGSIIVAGIQYSMAGADASKVQAAKHRMSSAILALVFFIFGFAILQWLIPGGLF